MNIPRSTVSAEPQQDSVDGYTFAWVNRLWLLCQNKADSYECIDSRPHASCDSFIAQQNRETIS